MHPTLCSIQRENDGRIEMLLSTLIKTVFSRNQIKYDSHGYSYTTCLTSIQLVKKNISDTSSFLVHFLPTNKTNIKEEKITYLGKLISQMPMLPVADN